MQPRPMRSGRPQIGPWPLPALVTARVGGPRRGVYVLLRSGQGVNFVQVLQHGPRDGIRGKIHALPTIGTQGLVVFPNGDMRNGVWLGAVDQNFVNANPYGPGQEDAELDSHASGAVAGRLQDGSLFWQQPDGSTLVIGNGGAMPALSRHAPGPSGGYQAVPMPLGARQPSSAAPQPFSYVQGGGTGASVSVSAAGELTITAHAGTTIQTAGGQVTITPGSGVLLVNGQIQSTGDQVAGVGGANISQLSHGHTDVLNGGGVTGGPVG